MKLLNKNEKISSVPRIIDFDIHGIVGLRLIDATASDVIALTNQLGLSPKPLEGEPDIVICFKEKLSTPGLKYLGSNFAGFTNEGFYILSSSRAPAKVRLPFEEIGGPCEIVCESGIRSFPLLIEIINLTFIHKEYIPIHASAFVYNGTGILVSGWENGGKTEALFSFANQGAQYVADDWSILSSDGEEVLGIPVPICLAEWKFKQISNLVPKISKERSFMFKSIHLLEAVNHIFGRGILKDISPLKVLKDALPIFQKQLKVRFLPEQIFADRICARAKLDKLFLIISRQDPAIHIEECDPLEIARRIISSNAYELLPFFEYYNAFKYAFPDLRNESLENFMERQSVLLNRVFQGKEAYKVLHPYPVSLQRLFQQMQPYCRQNVNSSSIMK